MRNTCTITVRIVIALLGFLISSCSKDDVITVVSPPDFSFDNETGIYSVKVGKSITITPFYTNSEDADFSWCEGSRLLSTEKNLTISWEEAGYHYITLTVSNDSGSKSGEIRIDVEDLLRPVISLPFGGDEILVKLGSTYIINPEILNSEVEGFSVEWIVNGSKISNEPSLTFVADNEGEYTVTIKAVNHDGEDEKEFTLNVLSELPFTLEFPPISYLNKSTDRYTFPGRGVYLQPILENIDGATFSWSVNGRDVEETNKYFMFVPEEPGEYTVTLTVNGTISVSVSVTCIDSNEEKSFRKVSSSSSKICENVFEWIPAPGQFIGENQTGGMTGGETSHELAVTWAKERLAKRQYVSLGGFGGYIIVGFDHSIKASTDGYDFAIEGNAFLNASNGEGGSNEPGIVYVMQDVNGNGLPDDEWYELRGSETGKSTTLQDYAVTYFRPSAPRMNVQWTDNYGQSGTIDYLPAFHRQDYYYPEWITEDSYTLRGTRLEARTSQDPSSGFWDNWAFDWGYADNVGNDSLNSGNSVSGEGQRVGFNISNAMYPDGSPVKLKHIDFIKVQTGVNSKSGWLGENSTEVFSFEDLNI